MKDWLKYLIWFTARRKFAFHIIIPQKLQQIMVPQQVTELMRSNMSEVLSRVIILIGFN